MDNQINGFLYVMVEKGLYVMVQAGIITHTSFKENLRPFGYEPALITPVFWHHNKNGITFFLVVRNFGIRYHGSEDAYHIINFLQEKY